MSRLSISRRTLLISSSTAGALAVVPALALSQGQAEGAPDAAILAAALAMEEAAIATYEGIGDLQVLDPDTRDLGEQIIAHHQAHAAGLREWLTRFGITPGASPVPPLAPVRNAEEALELLVETEQTAMDTYLTHAASLHYPGILSDAVSILVDEVKHHTVLSSRLGTLTA
jgi:rubrerythrin